MPRALLPILRGLQLAYFAVSSRSTVRWCLCTASGCIPVLSGLQVVIELALLPDISQLLRRCAEVQDGDEVEVVVMSSSQFFDDFQVVRDVYVPELKQWLCDYPFIKRDVFQRISTEVFLSRQAPGEDAAAQNQPGGW